MSLHPDHMSDLRGSGISEATITAAGIHSVPPYQIQKILGNAPVTSLLAFPYPGTDFVRWKLFPARIDQDGHAQKYHQPKGTAPRLYRPPGFNASAQLVRITEGEKKALKGTQEGLNVCGLGGIWNFQVKGPDDRPKLIEDLEAITWQDRHVEIIPDGDFKEKPGVAHAVYRLGRMLRARGAQVRVVNLPGRSKLDDLLVAGGVAAFTKAPRKKLSDRMFIPAKASEDRRAGREEIVFPDVYAGAAGRFADMYSQILEVPRQFLFFSYLACLGSVLADRITLESSIAPQPRMYVLLVGESADDRKSTALKKATRHFLDTIESFNVSMGVGSAEGMQRLLMEKKKVLLVLDEFASFVGKCNAQNSVLLPCVNTLFESNDYDNRTKTEKVELRDVYLSFLAASTRETFEKVWTSNFTAIGFDNRLWLVPGGGDDDKVFPIPQKLSFEDELGLRANLGAILALAGTGLTEYRLTDEGHRLFDEWYRAVKASRSLYAKRIDTYALRLMPLLAINEGKGEVDLGIVEKVIALCNWQLKVREELAPVDADNIVAGVEEKTRKKLKNEGGTMSERDLQRAIHAHRVGLGYYATAMRNLEQNNEITRLQGCVVLNPSS